MKFFKTTFKTLLATAVFGVIVFSSADASQMLKKIVVFNDGVTQQEITDYTSALETEGAVLVKNLPFINAVIIKVPDTITSADLSSDPGVKSVEGDQPVVLQAVVAAGDGGAGDGGAGDGGAGDGDTTTYMTLEEYQAKTDSTIDDTTLSVQLVSPVVTDGVVIDGPIRFITPAPELPKKHRPYGILRLNDMAYNPLEISDIFERTLIDDLVDKAKAPKVLRRIKVAIFDTGVDIDHPQFNISGRESAIKGGIDLINMTEGIPQDDNGHGTHVAATICGKSSGLAYGINIYPVKILDQNAMGDITTLIMGLQWAIDNGIKIINMSIAFAEDTLAVKLAIEAAHEAGVIMIASAGNHSNWEDDGATGDGGAGDGGAGDGGAGDGGAGDGGAGDGGAGDGGAGDGGAAGDGTTVNPFPVMFPASYPEVIAVGAHDQFGKFAPYSNFGPELVVNAPGTMVHSADFNGGYGLCSGTSMAAPHITGTVALMISLNRQNDNGPLRPEKVEFILHETAIDGNISLVDALFETETRNLLNAFFEPAMF